MSDDQIIAAVTRLLKMGFHGSIWDGLHSCGVSEEQLDKLSGIPCPQETEVPDPGIIKAREGQAKRLGERAGLAIAELRELWFLIRDVRSCGGCSRCQEHHAALFCDIPSSLVSDPQEAERLRKIARSKEVEQLEQKLARAKELEASAKAVTRRLQDDVMGRVRRLEANIRGSGMHRPVEEALMAAISEEVAKDWAVIEDEALRTSAPAREPEPVDEAPKPLVGNVTDIEVEVGRLEKGSLGGSSIRQLADLIRKVAEERDTALYWENHFRSQLRHIETDLGIARGALAGARRRARGALEDADGLGVGNYVNIPS